MKYTFSFFLVFALVLSSWQLAHGQASPWSEPYTFEQSGWFPGITTDFSGRVHLFWSQSRYYGLTPPDSRPTSGYDVVYYTSKTTREAWSPVTDIIAIPQYNIGSVEVTRPNPWAAPDGTLHLTYRNLDVFYTRALAWEAASPGAWHKASRLNIRNLGYFSDVIQDSRGRLHAVYTENQPDENCRLCYHLFYRYSDDEGQTWSLPFDLSALKAPPLGAAKPQLFLDEQENLHVIWESGAGGTLGGVVEPVHILHAVSFDSGQTWPIVHVLSQAGEHTARNPALAQDRQGRLVAVWMDSGANQAVYRISATHGRSWEPPHTIANVAAERQIHNTRQSAYALVGDSAGNLHLLMIGSLPEQSTSLAVLHLTWTGEDWLPPEVVAAYPNGDVPEWPQASVALGNQLHVTWFVRPADHVWDANPDFYTVWYSMRQLHAPALAPMPYPSPTALPTTSPPAHPTATSQPPTAVRLPPVDPEYSHVIYTENDDLKIIVLSLLPVSLLVTLWMAYTRYKNRL